MSVKSRIFSAIGVTMMIASALLMTACKKHEVISKDPITLPYEKGYNLTWWYPYDNTYTPDFETLADHPFMKRLMAADKTNITIEFVIPTSPANSELSNAIASDTLSDMVTTSGYEPAGGLDANIDDEVFYDLSEFVEVQMPNFNDLRRQYGVINKCMYTTYGRVAFIPTLSGVADNNKAPATTGLVIRKDMLDSIQLDVPVTIADWENVLTKLNLQAGVAKPLAVGSMSLAPTMTNDVFVTAYGIMYEKYLDSDGNVKYGATTDGMKSYIETMNRWYTNGLIAMEDTDQAKKSSNDYASWPGSTQDIDYLKTVAQDPNYKLVACPDPVVNAGDVITHRGSYRPIGDKYIGNVFIAKSCERPDIACKFLDQFFTEESFNESSYGVEGVDYNKDADGKITFTDKIMVADVEQRQFMLRQNAYLDSFWHDRDVLVNYFYTDEAKKAVETWTLKGESDNLIVTESLPFTEEEQEVKGIGDAMWMIQVGNLKSFITGETPMTEWDTYVQSMNAAGLEEFLVMYQQAWDRFCAA